MLSQLTQIMTTPPPESHHPEIFILKFYDLTFNLFELIKQQVMLARGPKIPQKLYLYSAHELVAP